VGGRFTVVKRSRNSADHFHVKLTFFTMRGAVPPVSLRLHGVVFGTEVLENFYAVPSYIVTSVGQIYILIRFLYRTFLHTMEQ
jgi:hypothetical protein